MYLRMFLHAALKAADADQSPGPMALAAACSALHTVERSVLSLADSSHVGCIVCDARSQVSSLDVAPCLQMILKHPEDADLTQRIRRHRLCLALVCVSQGIAFIHAGDPLLRSKSLDRDSYNSGTLAEVQAACGLQHKMAHLPPIAPEICSSMT